MIAKEICQNSISVCKINKTHQAPLDGFCCIKFIKLNVKSKHIAHVVKPCGLIFNKLCGFQRTGCEYVTGCGGVGNVDYLLIASEYYAVLANDGTGSYAVDTDLVFWAHLTLRCTVILVLGLLRENA